MSFHTTSKILLSLTLLLPSCNERNNDQGFDASLLIEEVKNQVGAFQAADTTLNAEGVVDLLWPEFTMLVDGNYTSYDEVKVGSKTFMASLESFHTKNCANWRAPCYFFIYFY